MTARRPAGRSANVARGPWWKPIGPDRSADGPLMGSPESRRAAPERSTWAAAHPSTGQEGGVSRLVGSGARTPNRVTTGPEPGAADRLARGAGRGPGGASRGGWRRSGARPRASRTATRPASRPTAPSPRPSSGGTPRPSYLRRHAPPARPPRTPTRGRRSPETGHQDTPGTDRGGPRGVGTPTTGERTACKGHGWPGRESCAVCLTAVSGTISLVSATQVVNNCKPGRANAPND